MKAVIESNLKNSEVRLTDMEKGDFCEVIETNLGIYTEGEIVYICNLPSVYAISLLNGERWDHRPGLVNPLVRKLKDGEKITIRYK